MGEFETLDVGDKTVRLYVAGDVRPGAPGVVVLHAWWGLNDDAIAYADRLAAAGFAVTAPDMMGGQVASTIEDAERLSGAAESPDTEPSVEAIALAAVDDLAERLGPDRPTRGPRVLVRCRLCHLAPGRARPTRRVGRVLRGVHGSARRALDRGRAGAFRRDRSVRERRRRSPNSRTPSARRVAR